MSRVILILITLQNMSYRLTDYSFSTKNNKEIFNIILTDRIGKICLKGFHKIDNLRPLGLTNDYFELEWPQNLKYLKTYFRPNFSILPSALETLHIVTQTEILKKDLPTSLTKLIIECPNSEPITFCPKDDDYDLYKISVSSFTKYNQFVGGYLDNDADNIKYYKLTYNYGVDGDDEYPRFDPDVDDVDEYPEFVGKMHREDV